MRSLSQLLCLGLLATGCGDILAFPVEASVDEFTVPGDPYLHHDGVPLGDDVVPPVEVALEMPLGSGSISLIGLELSVTRTAAPDGDDDDLAFLEGVDVHLTSTRPDTALPPLLVGRWDRGLSASDTPTRVDVGVAGDENIAPYLAEGFRLDIRPRGVVPYDDVSIDGRVTFLVNPL